MLEALWSIEFASNQRGVGAGVVVLETGRVLGGDPWFTIIGSYRAPQGRIEAEVEVKRFRDDPQTQSIFGASFNHFHIKLSGTPARDAFTLSGHVLERPEMKVDVRLVRRAELPGSG